jgi:hypothetical protein
MIVYVVEFGDYEGSYFVSVWSTEEKAEKETKRLNDEFPNSPNYGWFEVELDSVTQ